jgi:DNA-binding SARP family transcriptional activator
MDAVPSEELPRLRIWLLGQCRVEYDGRQLVCVRPRCESLLAYLLLHPGATQSRHHLAFLLWPDSTERQALTNLRHLLHDLRAALPDADRHLTVTKQTVEWVCDGVYLDVADFRHCSRPDADEADLQKALALYQEDLWPACYDDWIAVERGRLRQQYYSAVERLANARGRAGDWRGAIDLAERLLAFDPLHEATYRLLIRLHMANDDSGAALEVYHACVTTIRRELGVPPSQATEALYHRLTNSGATP